MTSVRRFENTTPFVRVPRDGARDLLKWLSEAPDVDYLKPRGARRASDTCCSDAEPTQPTLWYVSIETIHESCTDT